MKAQRAKVKGGWVGFEGIHDEVEGPTTTATDLMAILDTIEVPVVVVGCSGVIDCFNKRAADVLGLLTSHVGRPSRDVPVLARLRCLEQQCNEVITGGVETRVDLRDGEKWFVVRISPYEKGDGQVAGTVLTFTNVTAFRASTDQAVYERECTKAILNTVADPLVVLAAEERIQSGNRAFYTMFGISRDEAQGVPIYEFGNGAFDSELLHQQLEGMLAGTHTFGPLEVEHVFTAKGQRTLILDAHPLTFPGHSERRVLVTFQDITERKMAEAAKDLRSEEELRRSEAFLAEAQHLARIGSFSWKLPTDDITWSEQLYRIFEFEAGSPVTLDRIGTRVHPEDQPMLRDMIENARRAVSDFEYEHRLLMPNQSIKTLHLIARGIRHKNGELEFIGAVQDVTQRRKSEEALDQARRELAHVARVKTLAVLTASIAHELNQPLSGIITNASTCLRMLGADPPNLDGARETARRTIRDGNRASDVIMRLRALFARKHTSVELVDLNEATREVLALSASDLQKDRVILRVELAEDLPVVEGDRIQLQQVILNLIRNGSDALKVINDRPRQLLVKTELDKGSHVQVSVQDSGVGYAVQDVERLFEAFYTTKDDGMGIGLSVSRSIIESHQGRLWARLNDGPGATFAFSVPCSLEAANAEAGAA